MVSRRISLLVLGGFGVLSLLQKRQQRLQVNGLLGGVMLFFMIWACLSVAWSMDPALTARRLLALAMLGLGAFAIAKRFSLLEIVEFTFVGFGLSVLVGLCCEIALGTFRPFQAEYRFAGVMHPNYDGMNCALFLIASIFLARTARRRRLFYWVAALAGLCFLVLTKSRAALAGVSVGLLVCSSMWLSTSRKCAYIIVTLCMACVLYLAVGDSLFAHAGKAADLGRANVGSVGTLNSRTPLWQECTRYVGERPVLGYGYDSFWTADHLERVALTQGWAMDSAHNGYLDMVLGLGVIGGGAYILILALAIKRSRALYKSSGSAGYGFAYAVIVSISCCLCLESLNIGPSLTNFMLLILLAQLGFGQVPVTDMQILARRGAVS